MDVRRIYPPKLAVFTQLKDAAFRDRKLPCGQHAFPRIREKATCGNKAQWLDFYSEFLHEFPP
jgi:hypothetical protein